MTNNFLELLEPFHDYCRDWHESDWFKKNKDFDVYIQEVSKKEIFEKIESLWNSWGEDLRTPAELLQFYDSDKVEIQGVDTLAYYKSFRSIQKSIPYQDWGIHFNLPEFFAFNRRIAASAGVSGKETLRACFLFVLTHEENHFEIDLATLYLEIQSGQRGHRNTVNAHLMEEALGNGRGVSNSGVKSIKSVLIHRYASSGLPGYKDLEKYLTLKQQREAFNEILNAYAPPKAPGIFPFGSQMMKPRAPFSTSEIPLYLHLGNSAIVPNPTSSPVFNYTIVSLSESKSATKEMEKIFKRNKSYQNKFKIAKEKILVASDNNGSRLRKFHGENGVIEARVDRGMRMLLRDQGSGHYEIFEVGVDIYNH